MREFAVLAVLVLTACCVGPPQPEPQQTPRAAPPPPLPPPAPPPLARQGDDWRDWPLTPGGWHYSDAGAGSAATYGAAGSAPALTLRCQPTASRILLSRVASSPPPTGRVTVRTTYGDTGFAAIRSADGGHVEVVLATRDRTLDQMAFSRGRFMVMLPGSADLIVPARPEVARVIEDCRAS